MLILLDIDGVMVIGNSWKKPEFLNDGFPAFNNKAVEALQKLISQTSAEIILTTSHKSTYSIEEWKSIFKLRRVDVEEISRLPENRAFLSRKDEILDWVNTFKELPDFIIIDDDKSLNGLPTIIKNKLIQTNASIGLTMDLVDDALNKTIAEQFIFE